MTRVTISLLVASCLLTFSSLAQDTGFGVKGGLSVSGFNEDLSDNTDS